MRAKHGPPFQRRETGLCLHALPKQPFNSFCANSSTSGPPAHSNSFYFFAKRKSRIESDMTKTVVVIWIAIGVWYGPLISSLCFFIVKLPIQHIFRYPFLPVHGWSELGLQENKNIFWRLWTCFYECPLWLLVIAWFCILHYPEFLLKWFDLFQRSFCPCGGANLQTSFTAMV